jgi:hypothetical protein
MKFITLLMLAVLIIFSLYTNAQNIGIGTKTPAYPLTVQAPTNGWGIAHTDGTVTIGSYIYSAGIGEFGTRSNHPFYLFANNLDNPPAIAIDKGGINVGIGNLTPIYTLDVHSGGNAQFNLKEGVGGHTALFSRYSNRLEIQPSDALEISVGGIDQRNLYVGPTSVGIGLVPTSTIYKLSVQPGVNGSGIFVAGAGTRTAFDAQTGDLELDSGNAIISGTASIGGATSINNYVTIASSDPFNPALTVNGDYDPASIPSNNSLTDCGGFCGAELSIKASGQIWSAGFYALSDARYKDIQDISNSTKDLQTLNTIQITDYTLKDKMKGGNRPFKKVIAQQVEDVYPQVVEKGVNYIPNVYQYTNKIEKTADGYLLSFTNKHTISKDAKKIKLQNGNSMQEYDIVAFPSENRVLIKGNEIKNDKVFVYGEQVNDFRTVDYDGLTTLNISATQELSKLIKQQQAQIDDQNKKMQVQDEKIALLTKEVEELKAMHSSP